MLRFSAIVAALALLSGCSTAIVNPSFPTTLESAKADLARMRADPLAASRPIVIVGGYADPGVAAPDLARRLAACFAPGVRIVTVQVGLMFSMDTARDEVISRVQKEFPDGADALEFDVVAVSMGGLVARYAALPREGQPHLRIRTLYTIATPHRGAKMAVVPTLESRVTDMRAGSKFLAGLDADQLGYTIIPYARLGDMIVGETNTAPPGLTPHWVATPPLEAAHLFAFRDPRIIADIARRIRGEEPLAHEPAAGLPQGL